MDNEKTTGNRRIKSISLSTRRNLVRLTNLRGSLYISGVLL
jgi:hypothetical protein